MKEKELIDELLSKVEEVLNLEEKYSKEDIVDELIKIVEKKYDI